LLRIRVLLAS
jgi:DNA-binding response OmpR family regulator